MIAVAVAVERIEDGEGDAGQVFGGGHRVEDHGLVPRQAGEEIRHRPRRRARPGRRDPRHRPHALGDGLDFGKIHHHAVVGPSGGIDHAAAQGDFERIAVAVQVAALALVVGIRWPASNSRRRVMRMVGSPGFVAKWSAKLRRGLGGRIIAAAPRQRRLFYIPSATMARILLKTEDHSRDSAGMRYVYPVVSRRAGGVSIGINLNPNNACNWRCIYCQVPDLTRGGPPPVDLPLLDAELDRLPGRGDRGRLHGARGCRPVPAN
jgi:hypothetical protein